VRAGDAAVLLELEPAIDVRVSERAVTIAEQVRSRAVPGVRDVVPTFRSVAVYFDPAIIDAEHVERELRLASVSPVRILGGRTFEVPVSYGGEFGPDIADVAAFAGLSEAAVIALHIGVRYRVFMLGFLPGFAYMGRVDSRIASPRKASPRFRVPAGSVGIAGVQTGIYPRESPAGWQIIGRTTMPLFDLSKSPPALFAPGDTVRFVPA
jgi:inhibitor of KinA